MKKSLVTQDVGLVGVHRYAFRTGKTSKIIGVKMVTPQGLEPRLCYHIQFADGVEDFVPISSVDCGDFEFVTL